MRLILSPYSGPCDAPDTSLRTADMPIKKLRITGPRATPYELGGLIAVYDDTALLAVLDPVPLRNMGTELHVEAFRPTRTVRQEKRHVGRLIFLEICSFVSYNFPQIQAISFAFSRRVEILGGPTEQAIARAHIMHRIGAQDIMISNHTGTSAARFVVSGSWVYNEANLAALNIVLDEERARYRAVPIVRASMPAFGRVLRKFRLGARPLKK